MGLLSESAKYRLQSFIYAVGSSRTFVLCVVFYTNFLDYLLLTAVVPIIPDFLVDKDSRDIKEFLTANNDTYFQNGSNIFVLFNQTVPPYRSTANESVEAPLIERVLRVPVRAINENSRVGWLLSSKALVQLLANPVVGHLSNRIGYERILLFGSLILLISSVGFACASTYIPLLLARSMQGISSASTTISGMSMIATRYPDDKERSRAMGTAMGGMAVGILVGYPFGGLLYALVNKTVPFLIIGILGAINVGMQTGCFEYRSGKNDLGKPTSFVSLLRDPYVLICAGVLMFTSMSLAVLESTVPIWVMDTMKLEQWELGLIFIPDSLGYLIGTNGFPVVAKKYGRWLFTLLSLTGIAIGLLSVPFCTSIYHLIIPHLCLGLGVGIADAAIMPLLALLVDQRHVAAYGSVYAIVQLAVCLAYGLGPAISGQMVKAVGFEWSMWGMAFIHVLYAPLCWFLRNPPVLEEHKPIFALEEEESSMTTSDTEGTFLFGHYSYHSFEQLKE